MKQSDVRVGSKCPHCGSTNTHGARAMEKHLDGRWCFANTVCGDCVNGYSVDTETGATSTLDTNPERDRSKGNKQAAYGPPYRCETCCKAFAQFPDGIDKCTACSGDLIPEQTFREKWPDRDVKSAALISTPELDPSHPNYPQPSQPSALQSLLQAQQHSDRRDYLAKHRVLARLLRKSPQDFAVDQSAADYPGITHLPTGFQTHAPFSLATMATGRMPKTAKKERPVPDDWNDPADREDCPSCGVMHERGDGFCNSCGKRWPAVTKPTK